MQSHPNEADFRRTERRALLAAGALAVLTSVHHVYGAILYHTPERYYAVAVAAAAIAAMLAALNKSRATPSSTGGRAAWWGFVGLNAIMFVLVFGVVEGLYNHAVKNALFLGGMSIARMRLFFPAPMYEMPNNVFFEMTGVMQVVPAAMASLYVARLIRLRLRGPAGSAGSRAHGTDGQIAA
jgi:hypothetical protein